MLALLLTGCDPAAPPDPADPVPEESEVPAEAIVALPEDAVLAVTATATAGDGAILDISLIVHAPNPFDAPAAADGRATLTGWCLGEVDDSVVVDQGYSFTTVDVTATPGEGDWPAETPLSVSLALGAGASIAADGALRQYDPTVSGEPADYVPHCQQPVVIDGAGAGHFYLGIAGDVDGDGDGTPPLGGWTKQSYGLNSTIPGNTVPSDATFSDCVLQVTPLGAELGAPAESWSEDFNDLFCAVQPRNP